MKKHFRTKTWLSPSYSHIKNRKSDDASLVYMHEISLGSQRERNTVPCRKGRPILINLFVLFYLNHLKFPDWKIILFEIKKPQFPNLPWIFVLRSVTLLNCLWFVFSLLSTLPSISLPWQKELFVPSFDFIINLLLALSSIAQVHSIQ